MDFRSNQNYGFQIQPKLCFRQIKQNSSYSKCQSQMEYLRVSLTINNYSFIACLHFFINFNWKQNLLILIGYKILSYSLFYVNTFLGRKLGHNEDDKNGIGQKWSSEIEESFLKVSYTQSESKNKIGKFLLFDQIKNVLNISKVFSPSVK